MAKKNAPTYKFPDPIDNDDTLVGHESVMRNFLSAWDNRDQHSVHPVWMLAGPRGIGKATMAYKIARMVYGNVGDFFIVDMPHNIDKDGKPKTDGKTISVFTVRAMIERMQMSSMSGEWRVILIDSVDELSREAANAMLKILEEPPAKTLFLLTVHQLSNVLPTIRSRAHVEKMQPLTADQLRTLCMRYMPDDAVSNDIIKLANGSFGKIAALKTTGGDAVYSELIKMLENPHANSGDMMAVARRIATDPALYGILLDAIARFGLADIYPMATHAIADIRNVYLEPEIAIFKIITEIKKCL